MTTVAFHLNSPPYNNGCGDANRPFSLDGTPIFDATASASRDIESLFSMSAVTSNGL